jgi:hypothetical protein
VSFRTCRRPVRAYSWVPIKATSREALDLGKESAGERLGVGERQHVAGALDQRVLRVRHVPPDDVADRVVDGGRLRSLDDVDRRGHPGERVRCEQAAVEENVP